MQEDMFELMEPYRVIPILQGLEEPIYNAVRDTLIRLSAQSSRPVTILIQCDGGPVVYALWLIDLINSLNCEVNGVVVEANSTACALLQGCRKRSSYPNAFFHLHSIGPHEFIFAGLTSHEFHTEATIQRHFQDFMKAFMRNKQKHLELYVKRTGRTKRKVQDWFHRGNLTKYIISPDEALEMNIIDEILPADYKLFPDRTF